MPELNFELLQQNIRELIKRNGITQQQLANIAGMTQANVSKALNPGEKNQSTICAVVHHHSYVRENNESVIRHY